MSCPSSASADCCWKRSARHRRLLPFTSLFPGCRLFSGGWFSISSPTPTHTLYLSIFPRAQNHVCTQLAHTRRPPGKPAYERLGRVYNASRLYRAPIRTRIREYHSRRGVPAQPDKVPAEPGVSPAHHVGEPRPPGAPPRPPRVPAPRGGRGGGVEPGHGVWPVRAVFLCAAFRRVQTV